VPAVRVVTSDAHRRHDPGAEIQNGMATPPFEVPARVDGIRAALEADGEFELTEPVEHGLGPLTAVHDAGYLSFLEDAWHRWAEEAPASHQAMADTFPNPALRDGMGPGPVPSEAVARTSYYSFDTTTVIGPGTYRAARVSADIALTAADIVLGGDRSAYALCRPPGHHAPSAAFGGYCFVNNAAVVAQHAIAGGAYRVAVLDVDYHHGNGTQQIFYGRGDVLYASLHADPNRAYPYFTGFADECGRGAGTGTTLNVPLPVGCDDDAYLLALASLVDRIHAFEPELVVVSLGVDTYGADPLSDLDVTEAAFHPAGAAVAALALPLVIVQEGGYHLRDMGRLVRSFLRGVAGLP
jgi:acetoin utilization deacetylase AcuC-like enzyme